MTTNEMTGEELHADELPVFLVTTSTRKYDHLLHLSHYENLLSNHNISLFRLPWEYEEIQSDNMEFLLHEALDRGTFDKIRHTFFILEQTSVFLDAKDGEGPGQYFKKWWNTKDEEELRIVFSRDPGATIESGLALNVPGHDPLIFVNRQRGSISLDGSIREENKQYSWLSADDFNLYFIPSGANKVYNAMEINEFYEYDFRKPNFEKITTRLGEYSSIIRNRISIEELHEAFEQYYDSSIDADKIIRSEVPPKQSRLDENYGTRED